MYVLCCRGLKSRRGELGAWQGTDLSLGEHKSGRRRQRKAGRYFTALRTGLHSRSVSMG